MLGGNNYELWIKNYELIQWIELFGGMIFLKKLKIEKLKTKGGGEKWKTKIGKTTCRLWGIYYGTITAIAYRCPCTSE